MLAIAVPAGAPAQDEDTIGSQPGSAPAPQIGGSLPEKPKGFLTSPREAIKLADTDPKVIEVSAERGRLESHAEAKPPTTWQIGYYDGDKEVVQVLIDDPTKTIRESWTGNQVAWQMARGYNGQFGHLLNAPYVWIPLALLFFFGLFDFRRWRRMVHLDLLVLLSFGVEPVSSSTRATSASRCRSPTRRSSTCCAECCGSGSRASAAASTPRPRSPGSRSRRCS